MKLIGQDLQKLEPNQYRQRHTDRQTRLKVLLRRAFAGDNTLYNVELLHHSLVIFVRAAEQI